MFAGQPWPVADAPVTLEQVAGLDLYRRENPFRVPWPYEFRTIDRPRRSSGSCARPGFPEPYAFSRRVYERLRDRRADFDLVHDNQCLGTRSARVRARRLAVRQHAAPPDHRRPRPRPRRTRARPLRRSTLRRWYGFLGMQMQVARAAAAPSHGVGELEEGHRRPDGRRPRHAAHRAGRRRSEAVPAAAATSQRVPGRLMTTASADVPLKGLTYLHRGAGEGPHRARRRAPRRDRPARGTRARSRRRSSGSGCRTRSSSSAASPTSASSSCTPRPRSRSCRRSTRASRCPPIEAMACGVPLVTTTGGALPEVVGPHGETAMLVPPARPGRARAPDRRDA